MKQSLCLLIMGLGVLVPEITSGSAAEARFVLHARSMAAGSLCPSDPEAIDPNSLGLSCASYNTKAGLGSSLVYLVVGRASYEGVIAASCGIEYSFTPNTVSWVSCAASSEFTENDWPNSGGGIRVTWQDCEQTLVGGDGVHAVMGAFYITTYDSGLANTMHVTPNKTVSTGPELAVVSCNNEEENLLDFYHPSLVPYLGGTIQFAGSGTLGYSPCFLVPAQGKTWSSLKMMYDSVDSR